MDPLSICYLILIFLYIIQHDIIDLTLWDCITNHLVILCNHIYIYNSSNMFSMLDKTPRFNSALSPFEFQYDKVNNFLYLDQDESDTNLSTLNEFNVGFTSPNYINGFNLRPDVDRFDFTESNSSWPQEEFKKAHLSISDQEIDDDIEMENDENLEYLLNHLHQMKTDLSNLVDEIDDNLIDMNGNYQTSTHTGSNDLIKDFLSHLQTIQNNTSISTIQPVSAPPSPISMTEPSTFDKCEMTPPTTILDQRILPNHGVILMKWPESIEQLWEEYVKCPSDWSQDHMVNFLMNLNKMGFNSQLKKIILERNISIAQLETQFGSSWRNKDKNFSRQINRRKKIWNSIEKGLQDGLTLSDCIWVLEKYAQDNNKSLSSYYRGVPFALFDAKQQLQD